MKFGIIREGKTPPDLRAPLSPEQCKKLQQLYPDSKIRVQSSPHRIFTDQEYRAAGIEVVEHLQDCDVIFGIKEVPIEALLDRKTYVFFSHTIKKQPYNQTLMRAIIAKRIRLIDYELLRDSQNNRIIGFGYYAGLVGAYNGLRAYGLKFGQYQLPAAHSFGDLTSLLSQKVEIKGAKFVLTGGGKVAKGAIKILENFGFKRKSKEEFLHAAHDSDSVFVQLRSCDIYQRSDGQPFGDDFYQDPTKYKSILEDYLTVANGLIAAAYWDPKADRLFKNPRNLKVIADITCDINGSIPTTIKTSSIAEPFYDVNAKNFELLPAFSKEAITVMAIDNLPSELPRDASEGFGCVLLESVIPEFFKPQSQLLRCATIAEDGELISDFQYLKEYAGL